MKLRLIWISCGVFVLLGAAVFLISSNAPLRIEDIVFENLPDNRLRFKVNVVVNQQCDAVLSYWSEGGNDTLYSLPSAGLDEHTLWIVNTKSQKRYHFQVRVGNGKASAKSKIYSFQPKVIYQATPYFSLDYVDSGFVGSIDHRFFLTQKLSQPGAAMIIDHSGDMIWYQAFEKGTKVTHWTPHKTVLCILGADSIPFSGGDEIAELSLSGEVVRRFTLGDGQMDKLVHHDVRYDDHGNIYALTFDKRVFDLRKQGGTQMDSVLGDGIVVFNSEGKKTWEWSVFDHLDPLADSLIVKDRKDWVHANSLFRDAEGNFIISFRDLSQVWKVDHKTGYVIWKLGRKGDFNMPADDLFAGQHAVYTDASQQVIMLDNGLDKKVSRILAFHIDPHANYVHASLDVPLDREYFSVPKGNAYVFDHDKILVCVSDPKALLIVSKEGRVLWKVSVGGDPYRVELIDELTTNPSI